MLHHLQKQLFNLLGIKFYSIVQNSRRIRQRKGVLKITFKFSSTIDQHPIVYRFILYRLECPNSTRNMLADNRAI